MINSVKTIGIVGGGQLAKMMLPQIRKFGLKAVVLDPDAACPCSGLVDTHIVTAFDSDEGFTRLKELSDVITYEFEHISVPHLEKIEKAGAKIYPSVSSLKIIQDKFTQKQALQKEKIPCGEFEPIESTADLLKYWSKEKKPFMLKSRKGGYDGKGNFLLKVEKEVKGFKITKIGEFYVERLVDFTKEVSVIATRGKSGSSEIYPISENVHKDSILDTTTVPAKIDATLEKEVKKIARAVMQVFDGVGTFCIELFINEKTGEISVNEVAPRVHNSGHYSIEGCEVCQFSNHIRAILGLDPGSSKLLYNSVKMQNLVASYDGVNPCDEVNLELLNKQGVFFHNYGKTIAKKGRKMGHITFVNRL